MFQDLKHHSDIATKQFFHSYQVFQIANAIFNCKI